MGAQESLKEGIQSLDDPLGKILETGRDQSHLVGCGTTKKDDEPNGGPDHDHRVRDREKIIQWLRIKR